MRDVQQPREGPGGFVTLEGGEGAGKSTQSERLKRRLEARGLRVVTTREPGGSARAEAIRAFLLSGRAKRHGAFAEALLFAAARADHVDRTIRPALAAGGFVICDRFSDSTRVYQGKLGEVPPSALAALERASVRETRPNLTLVLDVPAKLGLARASQRRELTGEERDRFEAEGLEYHTRIRDAFLAIAAAEPERCAVIDASGAPESVERLIWAEVESRLLTPESVAGGEADHGG
ncbi:dTMP kinase [Enterovirga aerilata]|uniref:Thymidylate kinase n=1 Tax=Enterovirga aerilata TaxID=2730920 RepID=A0A849HX09_9HYPH|nr:dTMP kinase [Enterovirga sp. DB1703]NNM72076.1 dTMP kinase [Enterovirga sp. DB1703]